MINNDALGELTKYCARTCHVLRDVTQGRDEGSLSDTDKKALEDLGRYVDLVRPSPSTITNEVRIMRDIESMIRQCRNSAHKLRENHPSFTKERLIAWRVELSEILRTFDVRDCKFTLPTVSERSQGEVGLGGASAVSKNQQQVQRSTDTETLTPVSMVACCFLTSAHHPR